MRKVERDGETGTHEASRTGLLLILTNVFASSANYPRGLEGMCMDAAVMRGTCPEYPQFPLKTPLRVKEERDSLRTPLTKGWGQS